jgi:hypothetical protein
MRRAGNGEWDGSRGQGSAGVGGDEVWVGGERDGEESVGQDAPKYREGRQGVVIVDHRRTSGARERDRARQQSAEERASCEGEERGASLVRRRLGRASNVARADGSGVEIRKLRTGERGSGGRRHARDGEGEGASSARNKGQNQGPPRLSLVFSCVEGRLCQGLGEPAAE